MKYLTKQPHRKSCGVVAIVNILRSFGRKTSYKEILEEAGGLDKVNKSGVILQEIMDILNNHNIETVSIHVSRKKMLKYAKHPKTAVAVLYVWLSKITKGQNKGKYYCAPHIVMVRKNGKAVNAGRLGPTERRWKDTKIIWKTTPITVVCLPKEGGAK